jgi:hypothetical protein
VGTVAFVFGCVLPEKILNYEFYMLILKIKKIYFNAFSSEKYF